MKNLINVAFLISAIACNSPRIEEQSSYISNDTILVYDSVQNTKKVQIFDTLNDFSIVSFEHVSNYPSSDTDTTKCLDWKLTKANIKEIIKASRLINGHEWHYLFSHLPCAANGQLNQDSLTYNFSINSGSWMTIGNSDTTIMLGYFDTELKRLFLDDHWKEEEE